MATWSDSTVGHSPGAIVLLGGGGHATVCADVLERAGWQVRGHYGPRADGESDLVWLGADADLFGLPDEERAVLSLFPGIGDNALRRKLATRAASLGWRMPNAVSTWSVVSPSATLRDATLVMPGAILNAHCALGSGCIVNSGAVVEHHVRIGAFAHIAPNATLAGRVTVGEAAFIGAGAVVIPEVRIGVGSIVGAGATVVTDVPDGVVVVGSPARTVRTTGE